MVRTKTTPRHVDVRLPKCVVYFTQNPVTFAIHRCREFYLLDQKARETRQQVEYKQHVHTPPVQCTTTIMTKNTFNNDITRLQLFTVGGDSFRENIETLVSYNVCTDGIQQDCLYIEQGHLMMPTTFMTYSMAIDPRQTVVVTWTPIKRYSMPQGSRPSSQLGSPLYTSS